MMPIAALVLPSSDRHGSGLFSLTVELARPADDAALAALQRVSDVLAAAARQGAFPVPGCSPGASRMKSSFARQEDERCLIFEVEAERIDLRAFELFRNMGQRLRRQGIDVREMRLSKVGGAPTKPYRKPEPDERNEYDAYPAVAKVRFGVEAEGFIATRMRRCLAELSVPVVAAHVLHARRWLAPWFDLLEAGAYAAPLGRASETDSIRGDVELFDELSIEISVNRFEASEAAWSALVNLLDTCWDDGDLVTRLAIE